MSERLPETKYLDPEVLQKLGDLEFDRPGGGRGSAGGQSPQSVAGFQHGIRASPAICSRRFPEDHRLEGTRPFRPHYTKLYEAETNFDCHLLIDSSSSMTYGSGKVGKLEYAKFLGASLAYLVLKQRDSVGLRFSTRSIGPTCLPDRRWACFRDGPVAQGYQTDPKNGHRKTIEREA